MISNIFLHKCLTDIDVDNFNLFLILYADDVIIFSKSSEGNTRSLHLSSDYCNRWKLAANTNKTKIMVFRKDGRLAPNYLLHIMVVTLK